MSKDDIVIGGKYMANVNHRIVKVRVDDIRLNYDGRTRYDVTNLDTGRRTMFRSAQKFRTFA